MQDMFLFDARCEPDRCMLGCMQVANKVMELVMMQSGCDVCCTSEADRERMERVTSRIDNEALFKPEAEVTQLFTAQH